MRILPELRFRKGIVRTGKLSPLFNAAGSLYWPSTRGTPLDWPFLFGGLIKDSLLGRPQ